MFRTLVAGDSVARLGLVLANVHVPKVNCFKVV